YDLSHIGHARASVSLDVLYRHLKRLGYQVKYVRNFTDVNKKIIERTDKYKEKPLELSNRFCEEYWVDMDALHCLRPTDEQRVSGHIDQIIKMVEKIIENGFGYAVEGGDVFFSVDKLTDYGKLSGQVLEHTRAGERVAVDPRKRNLADFALWKAAKPDEEEPSWESPWGPRGRPGWHIECSAMSAEYLSPRFDIHGGGADLIFPHHEYENAQTRAACGEDAGRESSSGALYYVYQTLQDLDDALTPYRDAMPEDTEQTAEAKNIVDKLKSEFDAKMADDLNTVHILQGAYQRALEFINASIGELKKMQSYAERMSLLVSLFEIEKAARKVLDVLGLLNDLSCAEILNEMKQKTLTRAGLSEEGFSQKMEERTMARKNKDFKKSFLPKKKKEILRKVIRLEQSWKLEE
ncbi:hypothetical protein F2Q69_00048022, partial [Brassica cretica]